MTTEIMKRGQDILNEISGLKKAMLEVEHFTLSGSFPAALDDILRNKATEWLTAKIRELEREFLSL